jgi:hypothetical protein
MLFRPIRLIIFVTIAFAAGILFERNQTSEACAALQGAYSNGICREAKNE